MLCPDRYVNKPEEAPDPGVNTEEASLASAPTTPHPPGTMFLIQSSAFKPRARV